MLGKSNKRTSVCAKTIVASIIPRMNRMWKVASTSVEVVASTMSISTLVGT